MFRISHLRNFLIRTGSSRNFSQDWPQPIRDFLKRQNITSPTMIQEKSLPVIMANKDMVAVARTGSGKTLAFAIPALIKILNQPSNKLPSCLILSPTRELANQTNDVFEGLGAKSVVLVGGASRIYQINKLSKNQDVLIATPGRLNDLVNSGEVDLSGINYLVLDEADRMLDMGFEPQIREIIQKLPKDRQTLLWSATWPVEIQSLANSYMNQFEHIAIDSGELKANPNIKQVVKVCSGHEKMQMLLDALQNFRQEVQEPRILIFVNTKRMVDSLLMQLMRHRYQAVAMHGDRSQNQRDSALRLFKSKRCDILIGTDVAARGLDIDDITHVVNYDFPNTLEDYIHRIGRTARHEKKGTSLTFFTDMDAGLSKKLVRILEENNQDVPEELRSLASHKSVGNQRNRYGRLGGFGRRDRYDRFSRGDRYDREDGYGRRDLL